MNFLKEIWSTAFLSVSQKYPAIRKKSLTGNAKDKIEERHSIFAERKIFATFDTNWHGLRKNLENNCVSGCL